ncbi:MAG: hypothetical protein VW576_00580 [Opitutae bacterium]
MDSLFKNRHFPTAWLIWFFVPAKLWCGSHSESMGVLSVQLKAGSVEAPAFAIFSPGVKQSSIFRGPVKSVSENNVTFYRTPNIANPANLLGPLPAGVLNSSQARAFAEVDENGSVSAINLTYSGSGYLDTPNIFLTPPTDEKVGASTFRSATAAALYDTNLKNLSAISVIAKGRGYNKAPKVTIDGGPHYLKITDPDCNYTGFHFPIIANSDHVVELNNSADNDNMDGVPSLNEVFAQGMVVEIVKGWTLGSLFGHSAEELQLQADSNASRADWVYLLKEPHHQNRDSSDYVPHFHDGTEWKLVYSPTQKTSDQCIAPDQSVIIARRSDSNLTLTIFGTAPQFTTSWYLPEFNRTRLVSNPYPTELKISDLIGNDRITTDSSSSEINATHWLANEEQDIADNILILNSSGWATYWHDGTNLHITDYAKISARAGTGFGGALTQADFSMVNGQITSISNSPSGNVVVTTSENHLLKNGFWVTISDALGRLTNENKDQIDASGMVVDLGDGLIIESPVNGKWEITNVTTNTFELKECKNYADFYDTGEAVWSTGNKGAGYDANSTLALSITGGGGFGAQAQALVGTDGTISSINIIHGGLFYTHPPTITVHPGGWNKLGRGNAPIKDLTIPPGSGALLIRKHPHGIRSHIQLRSFLPE